MIAEARLPWACFLFDLDGTLADTVELILRCFRHTMRVHGDGEVPDARWLDTLGIPLRDQLAAYAGSGEELDEMVQTYSRYQRRIHDDLVAPFPGAVDVLAEIRDQGIPVGIVTSKRREMARRTLSCCGLEGAYDVLVGADDVTRGKPDPEPVLLGLERLDLTGEARHTLFVGDSPFDIRAGREAGTRTAAALWGPFAPDRLAQERPDYLLGSLNEVLRLLRPGGE